MNEFLKIFAGTLQVGAFIPYILAILYRGAKPTQATWINYAILDTVLFVGMCLEGVFNWQMLGIVLGVWIILVLSIEHGIKKWGNLERFCLVSIPMGILISIGFASPIWAMIINLILIVLASIPTFLSGWKDPTRESLLAWSMSSIACGIVITIGKHDVINLLQPVIFLMVNGSMVTILATRRIYPAPKTREIT